MVEMELYKIKINEKSNIQTVILKEKKGKRLLSIGVGIPEINAIKLKVVGVVPPRPLTHDLLNNLIHNLDARVKRIVIDRLEINTFYAKIVLRTNDNGIKEIDARPSDSIALALRAKAPIFVVEDVLNTVATFSD
jgi:bifunctional DNase/RNase